MKPPGLPVHRRGGKPRSLDGTPRPRRPLLLGKACNKLVQRFSPVTPAETGHDPLFQRPVIPGVPDRTDGQNAFGTRNADRPGSRLGTEKAPDPASIELKGRRLKDNSSPV
ncbi:MAG: hypothetical protein MZV70_12500 [Desulfobacterales bacterium]|nr:hypothetical protein [Desulfobacterales bacterium]